MMEAASQEQLFEPIAEAKPTLRRGVNRANSRYNRREKTKHCERPSSIFNKTTLGRQHQGLAISKDEIHKASLEMISMKSQTSLQNIVSS
jgi:hypothetical protein